MSSYEKEQFGIKWSTHTLVTVFPTSLQSTSGIAKLIITVVTLYI
jgi:hypothetical protein